MPDLEGAAFIAQKGNIHISPLLHLGVVPHQGWPSPRVIPASPGTESGGHSKDSTNLQWGKDPCMAQLLFNVRNCGLCVKAGPARATRSALSQPLTISFYTCNIPEHPAESLEKPPFKNLMFQQHFTLEKPAQHRSGAGGLCSR